MYIGNWKISRDLKFGIMYHYTTQNTINTVVFRGGDNDY